MVDVFNKRVKVAALAKLRDNVAIVYTEVYIEAFDDIGVIELSEDGYLAF